MKGKIAIVCNGTESAEILNVIKRLREDRKVEVVDINDVKTLRRTQFDTEGEPYIIHQQHPVEPFESKGFVCKGLHQYKRLQIEKNNIITSTWICQCGKKL